MFTPDRGALPCEPPTDSCLRACERRPFLITPDRRCFIQSMSHECAKRVTGNAVPAGAQSGVFAYTFPTSTFSQSVAQIPSTSRYHTVTTTNSGGGGVTPTQQRPFSRGGEDSHRSPKPEVTNSTQHYGTPMDTRSSARRGDVVDSSSRRMQQPQQYSDVETYRK